MLKTNHQWIIESKYKLRSHEITNSHKAFLSVLYWCRSTGTSKTHQVDRGHVWWIGRMMINCISFCQLICEIQGFALSCSRIETLLLVLATFDKSIQDHNRNLKWWSHQVASSCNGLLNYKVRRIILGLKI